MYWGHATSKDGSTKKSHSNLTTKAPGCFSGSAVVDQKNNRDLVAFYTAHCMEGDAQIQEQCIARSEDDGET